MSIKVFSGNNQEKVLNVNETEDSLYSPMVDLSKLFDGIDGDDSSINKNNKYIDKRLNSLYASNSIKDRTNRQIFDKRANDYAKENGFDKAVYKGKMGNKTIYFLSSKDDDIAYIGFPQYLSICGDSMEKLVDDCLAITSYFYK